MSDPPADESEALIRDGRTWRPWWLYAVLGFLATGTAAALLGIRTCL